MTSKTRIVVSSDHADIELRQMIAAHIAQRGWEVVDIGPTTNESTDYPKHGEAAARHVASGDCALGVILCGTGQGIMMAANKVDGVRCGVCSDTFSARMIRQHNDANVLSIGARVVGAGLAVDIVDAFLNAEFEGGRHAKRVDMIKALKHQTDPRYLMLPNSHNWVLAIGDESLFLHEHTFPLCVHS